MQRNIKWIQNEQTNQVSKEKFIFYENAWLFSTFFVIKFVERELFKLFNK